MSKFILSTMTNAVSYASFVNVGDLPVIRDKVTIKGGAGLPSVSSGFGERGQDGEGVPMWTAAGVVTPVSDEQCERLLNHPLFQKHLDAGLVKVLNTDITGNHKAVVEHVRDMTPRDGFAQATPKMISKQIKVSTESIDSDVQFN